MTDVFEEVEEGLRRDRAGQLWKTLGPWVIGACFLIILGVAANEIWRTVRSGQEETRAKAYSEAMDAAQAWEQATDKLNGNLSDTQRAAAAAAVGSARQDAIAKFTAVAKGDDLYAALAKQELAELMLNGEPDTAKAAGFLDSATHGKDIYADISRIKLAYLRADTATLGELTQLLDPLLKQQGPMKSMARELLAAKKFATGDVAGARADYQSLSNDFDAPQGVRTRVARALATMPKAAAPAPAPAASPSASASPAPAPSAQATK